MPFNNLYSQYSPTFLLILCVHYYLTQGQSENCIYRISYESEREVESISSQHPSARLWSFYRLTKNLASKITLVASEPVWQNQKSLTQALFSLLSCASRKLNLQKMKTMLKAVAFGKLYLEEEGMEKRIGDYLNQMLMHIKLWVSFRQTQQRGTTFPQFLHLCQDQRVHKGKTSTI